MKRLLLAGLIGLMVLFVLATADWSTSSCQPMGLKGVGQFEGGLYTQTWGGQGYHFDFATKRWQAVPLPDRTALLDNITLPNNVYVELQSDGFNVFIGSKDPMDKKNPTNYFKICN